MEKLTRDTVNIHTGKTYGYYEDLYYKRLQRKEKLNATKKDEQKKEPPKLSQRHTHS